MKRAFAELTSPDEIGQNVAELLAEGVPYVQIDDLPFADMPEIQLDTYIRRTSQAIGRMTLTGGLPGTEQWRLDGQTSQNASSIPFHTDNPFLVRPEEIVGFWSIRSSNDGGENIILPVADMLNWADRFAQHVETLKEITTKPVSFTLGEERASGLLLDSDTGSFRHDMKYVDPEHIELAGRFTDMLTPDDLPSQRIKLQAGSVLFFNNRTTLHARAPYTDGKRLSIRVRVDKLDTLT